MRRGLTCQKVMLPATMGHRRKAPFGGLFFCPNCELPPASPGILGSFPPPQESTRAALRGCPSCVSSTTKKMLRDPFITIRYKYERRGNIEKGRG